MTNKIVSLAYSPCPNDSYILSAVACKKITMPGVEFDIKLHDIDELNQAALEQRYDIIKVSCHTYLKIAENYRLLDTGAAVGYGNGPMLISSKELSPDNLKNCSVVFPGQQTTAYLLFQLMGVKTGRHNFVPYDEIIPRVKSGEFDCGVIIHESRFTFEDYDLHFISDLGEWWEKETGLPIPLGCFVIRKNFNEEFVKKFELLMRRSFTKRSINDVGDDNYIIENSQELDPEVLKKHIKLYVNRFTESLGIDGAQAIDTLFKRASEQGLI